ncbi:MAG: hypothetical protein NZL90_05025 [Aquificaceae bacterium]|nr:hypothetical protein [Aquificaceae bacterium]MDW8237869.1 hypothetical protein [Aquificaceae bacterium]
MYPSPASANDKLTAGILSLIFSIALVIPIFFLELSLPPREDVQVVPLELLPPPPPPELPKSQEPAKAKPKLREKPVAKTPKRPPAPASQRPIEKESPSDLAKETTPSPPLEAQPKQGDMSQKHLSAEAPASPPPPPPPSQKPSKAQQWRDELKNNTPRY